MGARDPLNIHIAVAELPTATQVVAERRTQDLYVVVAEGLSQVSTAVAVADVVCNALTINNES